MVHFLRFTAIAFTVAISAAPLLAAPVKGTVTEFKSPSGLVEQCISVTPFPGAHYSKSDRRHEAAYCELDVYQLALCPKLWSTSPGTILYEINASEYDENFARFEQQHCGSGHHAKSAAVSHPANFKNSVNDRQTSATYAPSSWVYYHLSRYFDTGVHVPVAVYRSMEAAQHHQRVVKPALALTSGHRNLKMLAAGWQFLDQVESGTASSSAQAAVLTDSKQQIFGVLLDNKGDRYGPEFNGTRESGWGVGQNLDFQQTAPFLALRSELPVEEAAKQAIHDARANPRMAAKLPADTSLVQVVFWMQDVLEITLLDYMFSQQDRIGNIDYNWRWYWIEDGELESTAAHGKEVPEKLKLFEPVRLRQSAINDNDAGVRAGYANFTKKAGMLDGLRHYHAGLYRRLGQLVADLESKGPAYQWMINDAGLSTREADAITTRASEAFGILREDCTSGSLALDLDPPRHLGAGPSGVDTSCDISRP